MSNADEFVALPLETRRRLLKHLVYQTIPEGEVKETADAPGVKVEPYTLYRRRDENRENYDLVHPDLVGIMLYRRDLRILDFLEGLFGRVGFTIPKPLESLEDIGRHITRVFREASAACQAIVDSVDVGSQGGEEITWEEFTSIQREIRGAHQQLAALEAAARKKSQKHHSWPARLVAKLSGRRA
ncbi:MAG: hypothetical protein WC600_17085 [Desulfobaccales bacterium]